MKMLHKTIRKYQKAVSLTARPCFVDAQFEGEEEFEDAGQNTPSCAAAKSRLSRGLTSKLANSQLVGEVKDLLPFLVAEMEKLRALSPDLKRSKEEQKKQAGFIQQRKRAGLNDLFKTLQALGFSYRYLCLPFYQTSLLFKSGLA